MKIWEIAKGMCENRFENGQVFQNKDYTDMLIQDGILVNNDWYEEAIEIQLDDDSEWEAL